MRPPNEWPDIAIRLGSSARKNGEPASALAASISSSTKLTSCGRSRNELTSDSGVKQNGMSAVVLPGCGGATTTNPCDASSGVRNSDWRGDPHIPCENSTTGYGAPEDATGASTTPRSPSSSGPAPGVVGYQTTVSSVRGSPVSTDALVKRSVRTPASNGPRARGSTHVPAVHSTTSVQCVCAKHGVSTYLPRSTQRSGVVMRQDTGRLADDAVTRPHATFPGAPQVASR